MAEPVNLAKNVLEGFALWARDEKNRVGDVTRENVSAVLRELGFVTQSEFEELELRVAQLEHRIRLLERTSVPVTLEGDGPAGHAEPQPPI
jgi:polyhydroxyalkanoate synthesis regulator phasin